MEMKIEAPWTDGEQTYTGMLGFIQQGLQQLRFFEKQQMEVSGKITDHLKQDIEGYEMILKSNSEANAQAFMEAKDNARRTGYRYGTNLEVIEDIKAAGRWV